MLRPRGARECGAGCPPAPSFRSLLGPTLELHDRNGNTIATNDNWKTVADGSSQQAEIEATTIPPTNDFEAALVAYPPAGSYTGIVRGNNNGVDVALVEIYNLQ